MKIYVLGSLNMDLVINAPNFPINGMTVKGNGFMSNVGGKGGNQASAVAKLGGNVSMIGCVGKEFGSEILSAVTSYGVNCDNVKTLNNVSSGIAVIIISNNDNRIILDSGANDFVDKNMVCNALKDANEGDILMCQLEIPVETVEFALEFAKEKGMVTMLNPAPASKLNDVALKNCDYFTPNQTEAEYYTDISPIDLISYKECAKKLFAYGIKNIIITLGSNGACYYNGSSFKVYDCIPSNVVDTTGAGDTFVGSIALCIAEGKTIDDAMKFASYASSITVSRKGAGISIPTKDEVLLKIKEDTLLV